jgi:iron-sulfur cluster assembly protein
MLAVTTEAAHAIQELVGDVPGAGLRISPRSSDGNEVQLGLAVTEPSPADEIVGQGGCQVFLDPEVAPMLDGHTLDARMNEDHQIAFTLAD